MTPIDQQIQTMEDLATRHYPDNEGERNACLVRLLTERLRTFHAMYVDSQLRVLSFDDLRRAGFSVQEIALGAQDVVR